ncbi:protein split ends [Fundulus heteroclitus]|uniref:protein split ends n=1 Tax=Fundulus heteroclitus TaxID=8078 RepID=UPI00165B5C8C|nr:protein split ends [Fundulus heteroclitus]
MAEDASRYAACLRELISSSFSFHQQFKRKSELLSYLLLCVAKMPFMPQVSITRSVSGLTGKERPGDASSRSSGDRDKITREGKGSSVKEKLALNLKQLGRKSQPNSRLTTARRVSSGELQAHKRERPLQSSQTDNSLTSSSGESLSKMEKHKHRRNSERHQRSASRNTAGGLGASGSAADSRRRRQQSMPQRNSRAAGKSNPDAPLGDISSIVKISLLNEKHKYDDVEYEDEEDSGVDERVVLKCTEWLRGLENTPVTVGKSLKSTVSSLKSF